MSRVGGGIKPVSKAAPGAAVAGRRSTVNGGKAPTAAASGPKGRGLSKAGRDVQSQPQLREPTISASHLMSLLGGGGVGGVGASNVVSDVRGLFASQEDRNAPMRNPRIHEFAPIPKGGRRRSEGEEDIITGIKKTPIHTQPHQQHQQQQSHPAHQQPAAYQPPNYWPPQSQQQPPHQHPSYNPPPPSSHPSHLPPYPLHDVPPPLVSDGPGSPVAKNRARAMGSTIFLASSADDPPTNTITGHFRGRVTSAAPHNQPYQQPQHQHPHQHQQPINYPADANYPTYLNGSSMLSKDHARRPQPLTSQPAHYGGAVSDEHKLQSDPYARQNHHPNPYDTRDTNGLTQRGQMQQSPQHQQQPYRQNVPYGYSSPPRSPNRGGGGGGGFQPPQFFDDLNGGAAGGGMGDTLPRGAGFDGAYGGVYGSPPRSPSHAPRASWGGGDISLHEVGSVGYRDEARRKKDEMRAILDAQVREKQAMGIASGGGGAKSTKYALRHRERQAELAAEAQRNAQQNGMPMPMPMPMPMHDQQHPQPQHQQPFNYNQPGQNSYPPQQHYQAPPVQSYSQYPAPPSSDPFSPGSVPHGRVRSDLHAGALEAQEGVSDKARAQHEFRLALAEQVREKERIKQQAKEAKELEDRMERIRLGIEPMPGARQGHQQHQPYPATLSPSHGDHPYAAPPQPQFGSQPQPQSFSPTHGGQVVSPSKVAENRGRQMNSNIFGSVASGGVPSGVGPPGSMMAHIETDSEKRARERAMAQQAFSEQIELKRAKEAAQKAQEEELDRKDEERLARDRLEMLSRYQGLDPQAAAQKAQATIEAAKREAEMAQQQQHQQQQAGRGLQVGVGVGVGAVGGGLLSPSSAKTLQAPPHFGHPTAQYHHHDEGDDGPQPSFEQHGIIYEENDPANEENIAKLTALTSAMNKKVENRRAKAQMFEDSGLLDESGEGVGGGGAHGSGRVGDGPNLDEYEEVPRRVSGVAVAGRRGGKQGPSNKAKKAAAAPSGAGPAKLRARSASRPRATGGRAGADSNTSKKKSAKSTAADRDRAREAEVRLAQEKRKASILARARREMDDYTAGEQEDDEDSYTYHTRRTSSTTRSAASSRKKSAATTRRSNKADVNGDRSTRRTRQSSASVSTNVDSRSRQHYGGDVSDGDEYGDLEIEVQPYSYDDSEPPSDRYSPSHSRIPAPRVQSGRRRKPLSSAPASSSHSRRHASRDRSRDRRGDYRSPERGGGGGGRSSSHSHHSSDMGPYTNSHRHQQRHSSHHSRSRHHSPHRAPPPPYGMVGGGGERAVNPDQYPWFAHAASSGSALDASLSGNSAFILLPSSSSHHLPASSSPHLEVSDLSGQSTRAPSVMRAYGDEDGILPDELDKLLQHYGQTVGLDSVFDTSILPPHTDSADATRHDRPNTGGPKLSARGTRATGGLPTLSTLTPRVAAGGASATQVDSDLLSPGGASLEADSAEWLQGSILSPAHASSAHQPADPPPPQPARAFSPASPMQLASSHSRSSLVRPNGPRVVDPFSKLQPEE